MKFGRDVTVDDGGNYMSRFMSERSHKDLNPGTEPTLNHAISVISNLLIRVKTCFHISNRPLPIHLHSHEIS